MTGMGARCYNQSIGRFMAHDPLSSAAPGWTGYRGMFNNPVSVTDPTGMSEENQSAPDVVIRMDNPYTDGYSKLSATSAAIGKMVQVSGVMARDQVSLHGGGGHAAASHPEVTRSQIQ